jgi:hypothetical protein
VLAQRGDRFTELAAIGLDRVLEVLVHGRGGELHLGLADLTVQILDRRDDLPDLGVGELEGVDHVGLR